MKIRAIPFGYRYDNGKIVIDKTTSDVVKEIFSLYVKGKSLLDIKTIAMQNTHLLQTLKTHIAMNIERKEQEDRSIDIKVRIAEIDAKFKSLLSSLSVDLEDNSHTEKAIAELMTEKRTLEKELEKYKTCGASTSHESKLNEVCHITELIENQPLQFDDNLIRQMLECVVVLSKEQIKIVFKDGTEIDQSLT